jgi:SAM-dependent methyltransferase
MSRARKSPDHSHYSYSLYADAGMAESFEARRFSGPIGTLLADTQEAIIARYLAPVRGHSIVDVGTGTGRAAIALARRGASVLGIDASAEMLAVAARRAREAGATVTLVRGDVHNLGLADRSFDAAICLRVLMHTPIWRQSLAELCRVSRHRVVFDYPALVSAAAIQSAARRAGHVVGRRLEAYRVFTDRQIRSALRPHGFRIVDAHRQFVLPIAFHKSLGSRGATERIEGVFERLRLNALLGSPVTVVAERCASS